MKRIFALAFVATAATAIFSLQAKAYDDPPPGTVSCGQKVTVRSSAQCNGGPATIIGGCDMNGGRGKGRQTICTKKKSG